VFFDGNFKSKRLALDVAVVFFQHKKRGSKAQKVRCFLMIFWGSSDAVVLPIILRYLHNNRSTQRKIIQTTQL